MLPSLEAVIETDPFSVSSGFDTFRYHSSCPAFPLSALLSLTRFVSPTFNLVPAWRLIWNNNTSQRHRHVSKRSLCYKRPLCSPVERFRPVQREPLSPGVQPKVLRSASKVSAKQQDSVKNHSQHHLHTISCRTSIRF